LINRNITHRYNFGCFVWDIVQEAVCTGPNEKRFAPVLIETTCAAFFEVSREIFVVRVGKTVRIVMRAAVTSENRGRR
jgi:hypothetical protein